VDDNFGTPKKDKNRAGEQCDLFAHKPDRYSALIAKRRTHPSDFRPMVAAVLQAYAPFHAGEDCRQVGERGGCECTKTQEEVR